MVILYGGGQFSGGRMVTLHVVTLMEGKWSCDGCGFSLGRKNGHIMVVVSLMEGE